MTKQFLFAPLLALFVACGGGEAPAPKQDTPAPFAAAPEPEAMPEPQAMPEPEAMPEAEPAPTPTPSDECAGLADYESFVDDYIAAIEDINDGDASAAASLVRLQGAANKAGTALASLEPGSNCYRRYIAIQKKMSAAAMRMGGASQKDDAESDAAYKQLEKANDSLGCMQKCQSKSNSMQQQITCMQGCQ